LTISERVGAQGDEHPEEGNPVDRFDFRCVPGFLREIKAPERCLFYCLQSLSVLPFYREQEQRLVLVTREKLRGC